MAPSFEPANAALSKRLLDQHDVVIDAFGGKLLLFPFDQSASDLKVLESGCADGHWLQHLSTLTPSLPSATYVGTDINDSFFPKSHPQNFTFTKHNVADRWPSSEHAKYDIVHQRLSLPGAAPHAPLRTAVKNLFDLVKPGGWIQLVEAEQLGPNSGPVFEQFLDLVKLVFDTTGAGWKYAQEMKGWLEEAGAVDVQEVSVDMAFGAAHTDAVLAEKGATCTAGAIAGLVMHAKMMGLKTGLSDEELDSMADRLLVELREKGANYPLRAAWGRKKEKA
ncbi:hypothetical protein SLS60_004322 [Paraconiothyrium brasiliense]|uniref:Methyltransferase domain-containing protein n=1 Tax=Paraconiothyrium brasiliense TaxID=300254 RepID=A0ABR3RLM2_9PLEO